jgi:hypothetical protein
MRHKARLTVALAAILVLPFVFQGAVAIPPSGPSVSMSWSPPNPLPNQNVTFTIDARDPDGSIQSVTITFGDGTSETLDAQRSIISDTKACLVGAHQTFTATHEFGKIGDFPLTFVK